MGAPRVPIGKTAWAVLLAPALLALLAADSGAATRKIDFDGDGLGDLAVYRQAEGAWYVKYSSGGSARIAWGDFESSDIAVAGDYDGDGVTDAAVFRPTNGTWYIKNSAGGFTVVQWGDATLQDVPVPADYDGDGQTDIAVYRQSTGTWYIRNSSGGSTVVQWGDLASWDRPVPGDYDGDGHDDIAVYRGTNGTWYIRNSTGGASVIQWGDASLGDWVMPGDYDGDGVTDLAVWRSSTGTWYIRNSTGGNTVVQWGDLSLADVPMPMYSDADNRQDIAVWRGTNGTWYIKQSADGMPRVAQWGDASEADVPVTGFLRPSEGDKVAIFARLKELSDAYATSIPDNATIASFIHPDYLQRGKTYAAQFAAWAAGQAGPPIGWTFSHMWVQYLGSPMQYLVGFVSHGLEAGATDTSTLRMARNGTSWAEFGDRTPFDVELSSLAILSVSYSGDKTTSSNLFLWGNDSGNVRPDIVSIKVTGPGLPVGGLLMNRNAQRLYALNDATIDAMGDIGAYTFQYFTGVDGSGSQVGLSNHYLRKRPLRPSELSDATFPTLLSPVLHTLSAANPGGVLNVSWVNPPNTFSQWASLDFNQSGYQQRLGVTQTSTSFDSTGIGYTPTWASLRIGLKDRYDRKYEFDWAFQY